VEPRPGEIQKASVWRILSLAFFFILVVLTIFLLPWKETWQVLRSAEINYIIFAFSLSIPILFFMSYAYKIILDGQNANISYWRLLLINMGMNFYDIVLPSTFIVSGLRWFRYSQQSLKPAQSFVSIAFYKVFNVILALILSLAFLVFSGITSLQGHVWQLIIILVFIIIIMLATPWICRQLINWLPIPPLEQQSRRSLHKAWDYIHKIIRAFAEFEQLKLKAQLIIIILGISNHLLMYACYLLMAKSVDVNLTYAQLGALRAILILAMNLPINFGIGINLRDVTLLAILTAMGIALDKAVAVSVISFGRFLFTGILGGFAEIFNILYVKKRQTPVQVESRLAD
jgi:uncharacterized membrane protein YbhN (UPF0104 family)